MNPLAAMTGNARVPLHGAHRRALHRAKDRHAAAWQTTAVTTFFAILLGAGLIYGTVVVVGAVKAHFAQTDSTANFRTFEVKRKLADGKSCRYLVFSNTEAGVISKRTSSCLPPVIVKPPPVRHRAATPFKWSNWGKH